MDNKYFYEVSRHNIFMLQGEGNAEEVKLGYSFDLETALSFADRAAKEYEEFEQEKRGIEIIITKIDMDTYKPILAKYYMLYYTRGTSLYKMEDMFDRLRKEDNPNGI